MSTSMHGPSLFELIAGDQPIVATAIHDGHWVRPEVAALLELTDDARLREEDPGTGLWAKVAPTAFVVHRSRFETDLNRPRDGAVYLEPSDAWGLRVWRERPNTDLVRRSLVNYDLFYETLAGVLKHLVRGHQRVVVLDLHSYNHRRDGPDQSPAPPQENPEVNIGTGSMNRQRWGSLVECVSNGLRSYNFLGRQLDVRENVKFRGGHLSRWIHDTFPDSVCSISIEFKKFFMDEWTAQVNHQQVDAIRDALRGTVARLYEALRSLKT
jgi:N-formylglutamate deformylase